MRSGILFQNRLGGAMADLDVTKKLSVYHLLYRLNLSFANIVERHQSSLRQTI